METIKSIISEVHKKHEENITDSQLNKLANQIEMTSDKGLLIRAEIYGQIAAHKYLCSFEVTKPENQTDNTDIIDVEVIENNTDIRPSPVKKTPVQKKELKEVGRLSFRSI